MYSGEGDQIPSEVGERITDLISGISNVPKINLKSRAFRRTNFRYNDFQRQFSCNRPRFPVSRHREHSVFGDEERQKRSSKQSCQAPFKVERVIRNYSVVTDTTFRVRTNKTKHSLSLHKTVSSKSSTVFKMGSKVKSFFNRPYRRRAKFIQHYSKPFIAQKLRKQRILKKILLKGYNKYKIITKKVQYEKANKRTLKTGSFASLFHNKNQEIIIMDTVYKKTTYNGGNSSENEPNNSGKNIKATQRSNERSNGNDKILSKQNVKKNQESNSKANKTSLQNERKQINIGLSNEDFECIATKHLQYDEAVDARSRSEKVVGIVHTFNKHSDSVLIENIPSGLNVKPRSINNISNNRLCSAEKCIYESRLQAIDHNDRNKCYNITSQDSALLRTRRDDRLEIYETSKCSSDRDEFQPDYITESPAAGETYSHKKNSSATNCSSLSIASMDNTRSDKPDLEEELLNFPHYPYKKTTESNRVEDAVNKTNVLSTECTRNSIFNKSHRTFCDYYGFSSDVQQCTKEGIVVKYSHRKPRNRIEELMPKRSKVEYKSALPAEDTIYVCPHADNNPFSCLESTARRKSWVTAKVTSQRQLEDGSVAIRAKKQTHGIAPKTKPYRVPMEDGNKPIDTPKGIESGSLDSRYVAPAQRVPMPETRPECQPCWVDAEEQEITKDANHHAGCTCKKRKSKQSGGKVLKPISKWTPACRSDGDFSPGYAPLKQTASSNTSDTCTCNKTPKMEKRRKSIKIMVTNKSDEPRATEDYECYCAQSKRKTDLILCDLCKQCVTEADEKTDKAKGSIFCECDKLSEPKKSHYRSAESTTNTSSAETEIAKRQVCRAKERERERLCCKQCCKLKKRPEKLEARQEEDISDDELRVKAILCDKSNGKQIKATKDNSDITFCSCKKLAERDPEKKTLPSCRLMKYLKHVLLAEDDDKMATTSDDDCVCSDLLGKLTNCSYLRELFCSKVREISTEACQGKVTSTNVSCGQERMKHDASVSTDDLEECMKCLVDEYSEQDNSLDKSNVQCKPCRGEDSEQYTNNSNYNNYPNLKPQDPILQGSRKYTEIEDSRPRTQYITKHRSNQKCDCPLEPNPEQNEYRQTEFSKSCPWGKIPPNYGQETRFSQCTIIPSELVKYLQFGNANACSLAPIACAAKQDPKILQSILKKTSKRKQHRHFQNNVTPLSRIWQDRRFQKKRVSKSAKPPCSCDPEHNESPVDPAPTASGRDIEKYLAAKICNIREGVSANQDMRLKKIGQRMQRTEFLAENSIVTEKVINPHQSTSTSSYNVKHSVTFNPKETFVFTSNTSATTNSGTLHPSCELQKNYFNNTDKDIKGECLNNIHSVTGSFPSNKNFKHDITPTRGYLLRGDVLRNFGGLFKRHINKCTKDKLIDQYSQSCTNVAREINLTDDKHAPLQNQHQRTFKHWQTDDRPISQFRINNDKMTNNVDDASKPIVEESKQYLKDNSSIDNQLKSIPFEPEERIFNLAKAKENTISSKLLTTDSNSTYCECGNGCKNVNPRDICEITFQDFIDYSKYSKYMNTKRTNLHTKGIKTNASKRSVLCTNKYNFSHTSGQNSLPTNISVRNFNLTNKSSCSERFKNSMQTKYKPNEQYKNRSQTSKQQPLMVKIVDATGRRLPMVKILKNKSQTNFTETEKSRRGIQFKKSFKTFSTHVKCGRRNSVNQPHMEKRITCRHLLLDQRVQKGFRRCQVSSISAPALVEYRDSFCRASPSKQLPKLLTSSESKELYNVFYNSSSSFYNNLTSVEDRTSSTTDSYSYNTSSSSETLIVSTPSSESSMSLPLGELNNEQTSSHRCDTVRAFELRRFIDERQKTARAQNKHLITQHVTRSVQAVTSKQEKISFDSNTFEMIMMCSEGLQVESREFATKPLFMQRPVNKNIV